MQSVARQMSEGHFAVRAACALARRDRHPRPRRSTCWPPGSARRSRTSPASRPRPPPSSTAWWRAWSRWTAATHRAHERARADHARARRRTRETGSAVARGGAEQRPPRSGPRRPRRAGGHGHTPSSAWPAPAERILQVHAVPPPGRRRRGGRRRGPPRRHRAPTARARAHGVRRQRLARAAHAAHRHPRLSGDAARRRPRGAASTRGSSSRSCSATPSGSAACSNDLTDLSNIELGGVSLRARPRWTWPRSRSSRCSTIIRPKAERRGASRSRRSLPLDAASGAGGSTTAWPRS